MSENHVVTESRSLEAADPDGVRAAFREALGHFCSGVVVVSALGVDGRPVGMTVGSFTSISLAPPLVGFYAGETSTTLPHIVAHGRFCANVLAEDQGELARAFAVRKSDKFEGIEWSVGTNGAPRLAGAHAWIDCTITQQYTIGDHELVVGAVEALAVPRGNEPLVFHRSLFHGLRAQR